MWYTIGLIRRARAIRGTALTANARLLRGLVSRSFLGAGSAKDARHDRLVALVTCVFIDGVLSLLKANHSRPGCCPRCEIREGDLVADSVGRSARKALDQVQGFSRSPQGALRR